MSSIQVLPSPQLVMREHQRLLPDYARLRERLNQSMRRIEEGRPELADIHLMNHLPQDGRGAYLPLPETPQVVRVERQGARAFAWVRLMEECSFFPGSPVCLELTPGQQAERAGG